ncbi:MAG TPA: adenylosuccinate synthetase, partial [Candidatus Saccharimonadia bacterium]|nr:adenylosuccinate synthetase [Candidatus Saccharimonadia bacterium]
EDAFEYGATTKRPRDIAYLDLPAIKFFTKSGQANALILTHMDVVYEDTLIKICVGYTRNGKAAEYRPDQEYLNTVKPVYKELKSWDVAKLRAAKTRRTLPTEAKQFLSLIEKEIDVPIHMITTGPKREQGILLSTK